MGPLAPDEDCPGAPAACFVCRRELEDGMVYHAFQLGMNESPLVVGTALESESAVEEVDEYLLCQDCQPLVQPHLDRFCEQLWALRVPDPEEGWPLHPACRCHCGSQHLGEGVRFLYAAHVKHTRSRCLDLDTGAEPPPRAA